MNQNEERAYITGSRVAWAHMLQTCLRNLETGDPQIEVGRWVVERQEIALKLRDLCGSYGDNSWPDNAYLPDVIDKYLAGVLIHAVEGIAKAAWQLVEHTTPRVVVTGGGSAHGTLEVADGASVEALHENLRRALVEFAPHVADADDEEDDGDE